VSPNLLHDGTGLCPVGSDRLGICCIDVEKVWAASVVVPQSRKGSKSVRNAAAQSGIFATAGVRESLESGRDRRGRGLQTATGLKRRPIRHRPAARWRWGARPPGSTPRFEARSPQLTERVKSQPAPLAVLLPAIIEDRAT
jgi:hypothetical protein